MSALTWYAALLPVREFLRQLVDSFPVKQAAPNAIVIDDEDEPTVVSTVRLFLNISLPRTHVPWIILAQEPQDLCSSYHGTHPLLSYPRR